MAPAEQAIALDLSYPVADSIGFLMRSTMRVMRQVLRARLREAGLDLGVWFYLRVLWEEEGLTQKELTQRVDDLQPSSVAALRSLEKSDLVRLDKDPRDKRQIRVFLTSKGRAQKRRMLRDVEEVNERIALAGFSASEARQLREYLRRMRTNAAANTEH